ncbi:SurA N-terminal domain-containing protein [Polaromonas sp. JS666]|uniref:SurA N-terminal domain-containing protein n=1 Tax=Polaromonas sp. (strain JS666 / ATCC BAA-500) TaxID=296591 RepID=UPI00004649D6|nr:SurA N-terminal domain-containing protein [Polaromonas sp. JS666]ABE44978.1 PpiC-type peptidyl-prolyl cis-trans isomerase [Polaromonas sp. JS666]
MFDFIRKHTKVTMALLFLLIVPSFILFGLDGYNRSREQGVAVARVDGKDIIQSEWDRAHQLEVDRLRASMPSLDAKLLDSPQARYATLERLVRDRVIAAAADKFKLVISDQRLARELQQSSEIASLRRSDGNLDMERYRQVLGSQGMSPEMFEANVRADLSNRQVLTGIGASGFSSSSAADLALNAYFEKREIQLARFNAADFAAKLSPTDADLDQFYKANEKLFQAPEQASIEYVMLDVETVRKSITINEADLKTYYEQNLQRLSGAEERRASHILITSPKTASAEERQKAKAKAEELLAAVKKSPDTFADVARKNSQDPGSAPSGGDLDFFARGAMVKPFEDAVFSMKKGDISAVVESEFGYHIIRLTDIKAPKQRSFEEMKPELEADLKKQQAQKKFSEAAEAFTNGVYEQAGSLKPVAERLKLDIKTASNVTRQPSAGTTGVLANPKFLNALFGPDAVEKKRNTEAIEVAPSQLVSGRILQYTPARTQPFAEVKDIVRQRWLAQRSAEEARKEGLAKLVAWKAAPASAVLAAPVLVSREQTQNLPVQVIDAALRVDASALPVFAGVDLGAQGYAIVKVAKVMPRDARPDAAAKQERNQYAQWWTSAENLAYYNGLKERFKAEILVAKPASVNADEVVTQ